MVCMNYYSHTKLRKKNNIWTCDLSWDKHYYLIWIYQFWLIRVPSYWNVHYAWFQQVRDFWGMPWKSEFYSSLKFLPNNREKFMKTYLFWTSQVRSLCIWVFCRKSAWHIADTAILKQVLKKLGLDPEYFKIWDPSVALLPYPNYWSHLHMNNFWIIWKNVILRRCFSQHIEDTVLRLLWFVYIMISWGPSMRKSLLF